MLSLVKFSLEDKKKAYQFFKNCTSENGFENPYFGMSKESFFSFACKERIDFENGITNEHYVPDTWYFLHEEDEIIGLYKLRHHLNSFLEQGPGHVGYYIIKEKRRQGYGKKGLLLLIEEIKKSPFFHEEEIYFSAFSNNIASIKMILSCGGYIHHISADFHYLRIPLKSREFKAPIVDHDYSTPAKINPYEKVAVPSKLVISFFGDAIETLKKENKIFHLCTISGETTCPVYKFVDSDVILIRGVVGSITSGFVEDLVYSGVKDIVFVGGAGALDGSEQGEVMVVRNAYRDEGFSYHYLPPSMAVTTDYRLQHLAYQFLKSKNVPCCIGDTWTTEGFYRETLASIKKYQSYGCKRVEMEQAGLVALSIFRKFNYIGLLYSGDDVSKEVWQERKWKTRTDLRLQLTLLALELVKLI